MILLPATTEALGHGHPSLSSVGISSSLHFLFQMCGELQLVEKGLSHYAFQTGSDYFDQQIPTTLCWILAFT